MSQMLPRQIASLLLFSTLAVGQSSDSLRFEAAFIFEAAPPVPNEISGIRHGGPGTNDPRILTWRCTPLMPVLQEAFDARRIQIVAPAWIQSVDALFDINVTVPAGATKDDVRVMLRNLFADRFGMKIHRETKEFDGFELVEANSGPKLDKFPSQYPDLATSMILKPVAAGRELEVHNTTVKDFARMIENMEFANRQPVTDKTGLTGHYAFTLQYSSPGSAAPSKYPTLNSALEEVLGLTLRQAKVAVELLVIDNLDPMPTPN